MDVVFLGEHVGPSCQPTGTVHQTSSLSSPPSPTCQRLKNGQFGSNLADSLTGNHLQHFTAVFWIQHRIQLIRAVARYHFPPSHRPPRLASAHSWPHGPPAEKDHLTPHAAHDDPAQGCGSPLKRPEKRKSQGTGRVVERTESRPWTLHSVGAGPSNP